jgi:hypothetical protein
MSYSTSDRLDPLRAAIESGDKSRIADELHMLDKPSPGFASDDGSMRSHVLADHTDKNGETSYHQDQDQDQDQGTATSPPTCPPGPGGISDAPPGGIAEPSILDIALDEYRRGNLTPVDVELGEMPDRAGAVMIAVAEHMRLLMGLRLALGEDRPLPYAASMPVARDIHTDVETLTIGYETADDGWVAARIVEVPAAISQGRTRGEARVNVIGALYDLTHEPTRAERALYRLRSLLAGR